MDRRPFLFDPAKNSLFYLALLVVLIALGLNLYEAINGHYSIIGSVASFLGLFVAFQSWRAADEASRKTDEALQKMHDIAHETQELAHSNYAIDQQIRRAVDTISDATRELHKGLQPILEQVREFLDRAAGSEFLAIMTDSAAIGKPYEYFHHPPINPRELHLLTTRIHDLLLARAQDAREFYLATLGTEEQIAAFPPTASENALFSQYVQPFWRQFNPDKPLTEADWNAQRQIHRQTLEEVQAAFHAAPRHQEQKAAGLGPHLRLPVLPLQVFIQIDLEGPEPFRALVIFLGQYNLNKLTEARAMLTADPELVRAFVSMFESITGLDQHAGYQQLRGNCPL
jgi:hypothetical protein